MNKYLLNFICLFVLTCTFSISLMANQVEYWTLKPVSKVEIDGKTYNAYQATFLSSQDLRYQLSIKDADQLKKVAWAKLETPLNLSFGQNLILYISSLHPNEGYIDFEGTKILCKMEWDGPESETADISAMLLPVAIDPFIISGQPYFAYMGKINKNDYNLGEMYCHSYGWNLDTVCYQYQSVSLAIDFEGEASVPTLNYHWVDKVIVSSERSYDPVNVINNSFMNMCKEWKIDDVVIILVHENYPAYYWIVNTTRNGEAFFCKGTEATNLVSNIWDQP